MRHDNPLGPLIPAVSSPAAPGLLPLVLVNTSQLTIGPGDELPRSRAFLLLRYTLILATTYLLLVEGGFKLPPVGVSLLLAGALASNVVLTMVHVRVARSPYFDACIILGDTLWITAALLQSGRFNADFFYLYFFVVLLAAIGENLGLIAIGALVVCVAYMYLLSVTGRDWSFWESPSLIRIPFLFTASAFYGYLVDETRRQRRKADEADRIKSEFLGTISHELRTPLNVMLGYLDLLLDRTFGPLPADQEQILRQVRQAGGTLHTFIGGLLDVSRIVNRLESGKERVVCSDVDLASLFDDLRAEFPSTLTTPVDWRLPPGLPFLYTDRDKLATILRNLVQNAVKYTPCGSVTVEAAWFEATDSIDIRVTDTGVGISREELPHIFDKFRRAHSDPNHVLVSGVGLGLYIVRQFVELLGGKIQVSSTLDTGSTFTLQLPHRFGQPIAPAQPDSLRVPEPTAARPGRETRLRAVVSR